MTSAWTSASRRNFNKAVDDLRQEGLCTPTQIWTPLQNIFLFMVMRSGVQSPIKILQNWTAVRAEFCKSNLQQQLQTMPSRIRMMLSNIKNSKESF